MKNVTPIVFCAFLMAVLPGISLANSAPVVSGVTAAQRGDDSKLVDIYYNLADADGDTSTVWVVISDDGGTSWNVPPITVTGAIGPGITPGNGKHVIWDAGKDMPGKVGSYKARVYADDGKGPAEMVFVPAGIFPYQNNTPTYLVSFWIDKYEVTNDFYCQFLNAADPNGDHYYSGMEIDQWGTYGSYYYTIKPGKGQYPIMGASAYDAEAFAAWRSSAYGGNYRLPTEQEWEKAAGWDPVLNTMFQFGYHSNDFLDCTWGNHGGCYNGALPVGSFNGTGGKNDAKSYYGCYDMSGNAWELTLIEPPQGNNRILRGGTWSDGVPIFQRSSIYSTQRWLSVGFRLILDLN